MNNANQNNGGFTFSNGDTQFTTPAPSQSAWDILLAVTIGAAIAIVAGMAQSGCGSQDSD